MNEKASSVNFLWGFLALVFAVALVRGVTGGTPNVATLVVLALLGALLVGAIGIWVFSRRHPARLEISPEQITYSHRGQPKTITLLRSAGDLYVHSYVVGGSNPTWMHDLKVTGSEASVPLQMFDHREVERACIARGWRFADQSR